MVGYEHGLRGYAAWYVRYGRCIARIKEKNEKKRKRKGKKSPWMYKQTMGIGEVGGWAIVVMWGGDWELGRCVKRAGLRGQAC